MNAMSSENRNRIYGLDFLRAIAISAVVIYHLPRSPADLFFRAISHFGYWGVDLFFVLSGFLIGSQFFKQISSEADSSLKTFYLRRFFRTLPVYFIFLCIMMFYWGVDNFFEKMDWRYILFLQNFGGLYELTHTWSLCIEEHFYLFFPIIGLFVFRKLNFKTGIFVFASIVFAGIVARLFIWNIYRPDLVFTNNIHKSYDIFYNNIMYPSYNHLDGLSLGVLLGFIKVKNKALWNQLLENPNTKLIFGTLFCGVAAMLSLQKVSWYSVGFAIPSLAIGFSLFLLSSLNKKSLINKIEIPGIGILALISYSMYMIHPLALEVAKKISGKLEIAPISITGITLNLVVILAFSTLLYILVEKPFLLLRDRIFVSSKITNSKDEKKLKDEFLRPA